MCGPVMLEASYKYSLLNSQVVRHFWERNDIKGALNALRKLPDHSVSIYCNFFHNSLVPNIIFDKFSDVFLKFISSFRYKLML